MDQNGQEDKGAKNVRVTGAIVLIALDDGSVRQAQILQDEHVKTVVNICTMNEKRMLILGETDFSSMISELLADPEDAENDDSGISEKDKQ